MIYKLSRRGLAPRRQRFFWGSSSFIDYQKTCWWGWTIPSIRDTSCLMVGDPSTTVPTEKHCHDLRCFCEGRSRRISIKDWSVPLPVGNVHQWIIE